MHSIPLRTLSFQSQPSAPLCNNELPRRLLDVSAHFFCYFIDSSFHFLTVLSDLTAGS